MSAIAFAKPLTWRHVNAENYRKGGNVLMPLRRLTLALPLACMIAAALERLTFEAASVKPVEPGGGGGGGAGTAVRKKAPGLGSRRYEAPTGGPGTTDPGRIH
jgi:hypothetical protein